jgi:hypothetical protein
MVDAAVRRIAVGLAELLEREPLRLSLMCLLLCVMLAGTVSGRSPALAQLNGHGGPVRALAVSADGTRWPSPGVLTHRRSAGRFAAMLHESAVNAVAFLRDGRAVTAGADAVSASLLKQRDNSQEQRAETADDRRCHCRKIKVSAAHAGVLAVFFTRNSSRISQPAARRRWREARRGGRAATRGRARLRACAPGCATERTDETSAMSELAGRGRGPRGRTTGRAAG